MCLSSLDVYLAFLLINIVGNCHKSNETKGVGGAFGVLN